MDNYIVINGKKAELTQEQLEKLGIVVEKDLFKKDVKKYYFINSMGEVISDTDIHDEWQDKRYSVANHCTDKELMEQRALHETLNRLLWRYSMQNGGDEVAWSGNKTERRCNYKIFYDYYAERFKVSANDICKFEGTIYFNYQTTAEAAIEEIVKPFIEQHPEFRW